MSKELKPIVEDNEPADPNDPKNWRTNEQLMVYFKQLDMEGQGVVT